MKNISIILPVFNEEENLTYILDKLVQLTEKLKPINFEIIAVNDGSTDTSPNILKNYNIKILQHEHRLGYGASIKDGIKNSSSNNIIILDADRTYPPFELYRIIKVMDSAKLVIGTRANYFSLIRHFANKMLAFLASLLFFTRISDLNSGMRFFEKETIQQLNYSSWTNSFSFTTTMTLSAIINNVPITEIPIRCETRQGSSKLNIFKMGYKILRMIFHFFKIRRKSQIRNY